MGLLSGFLPMTSISNQYIIYKRVVRAIAFMNFTSPSSPIFSDLKILQLYDLFHLKLLLFVYESVNRNLLLSFSIFLKFCQMFINMIQGRLVRVIFS